MKQILNILLGIFLVILFPINIITSCKNQQIKKEFIKKEYSDDLLNIDFELEKSIIDIDTINTGFIKIKNYDLLNKKSMPSIFIYNKSKLISIDVNAGHKSLAIVPMSGVKAGNNIPVIVKSKNGFKTKIIINIKKILINKQFKLETNSMNIKTNSINYINIINWDNLWDPKYWPSKFTYSLNNVIEAFLDSANHRIVLQTNSQIATNLVLTISSQSNHKTKIIININTQQIDLSNNQLVKITNILAGNYENEQIDLNITIGNDGFKISNQSIINNFNEANNLKISLEDVEIIEIEEGNNGINAIYKIAAKPNSQFVKNHVILVLNRDVDPNEIFKNTNLGEIRLFEGAYNNLHEIFQPENKKFQISLAALIFENIGDKNKILKYIKNNLIADNGLAGRQIMAKSEISYSTFKIKEFPTLNGIFKSDKSLDFTFKFVKEDRITLTEGLPEDGKLHISKSLKNDKSFLGKKAIKKEIYYQLNELFKNKITEEVFINYTDIIYENKYLSLLFDTEELVKLDVLPGSNLIYGHDGAAFHSYINCENTVIATFTGAGALSYWEPNHNFELKYKSGMGYLIANFPPINGNFFQGYDILLFDK